jgi:hypothetical protein
VEVLVSDGSDVVPVPFPTPGTEVAVAGLWCRSVVGEEVVSVGWVGEVEDVVSDGASEVGGTG